MIMHKRIIIGLSICLGLSIIAMFIFFYNINIFECEDTQIDTYQSPNAKHLVTYYGRDCGATTSRVENIELDGKTVLRAVVRGDQKIPFSIKWVDDGKVSVDAVPGIKSVKLNTIIENMDGVIFDFDEKIKGMSEDDAKLIAEQAFKKFCINHNLNEAHFNAPSLTSVRNAIYAYEWKDKRPGSDLIVLVPIDKDGIAHPAFLGSIR